LNSALMVKLVDMLL